MFSVGNGQLQCLVVSFLAITKRGPISISVARRNDAGE